MVKRKGDSSKGNDGRKGGPGGLALLPLTLAGAWIGYSRFFINHRMPLPDAVLAERNPFLSQAAGWLSYYVDKGPDSTSATTEEERPYCITLHNVTMGVVGIVIAFGMGSIAHHRGAIIAIVAMGFLNVVSILYTRLLPEPDTLRDEKADQ